MASRIIGCGGYLPEKILDNFDLEKFLDTTNQWIFSRTGIKQRHIASDEETVASLGYNASIKALSDAKINKKDIDLIIFCTTTPDNTFPAAGSKLQAMLGLTDVPAFDLQAVCSGFVYGLDVARHMLNGNYKTILLVCADKMSSLLDWKDRSTAVLFGDGAGAIIIQNDDNSNSGIIDTKIHCDGNFRDILYTDGGVSSTKSTGVIKMDGQATFKMAIEKMSESVLSILETNNLSIEDIDYIIPHQANIRIINSIAKKIQLKPDKIISTIHNHANCSAASIPLALNDTLAAKRINKNDLIVFVSFGAGLTWGSAIYRW